MREHFDLLDHLEANPCLVRSARELEAIDGLVLPGGESTAQHKLMMLFGLYLPLQQLIREGLPVLGTCAGLIHLANDATGLADGQRTLDVLDVKVNRNAYGSQINSFEAEITFRDALSQVAFIRAPKIESVGPGVDAIATFGSDIVVVRQGNVFGSTCHPEITGDTRLHAEFLATCQAALV